MKSEKDGSPAGRSRQGVQPNFSFLVVVMAILIAVLLIVAPRVPPVPDPQKESARIADLRQSSPVSYLAEIRTNVSRQFFLNEARELLRSADPQGYLRAVRPVLSEPEYWAEMKELDAAAYSAEIERRASEIAAEKQSLLDRLPSLKSFPHSEQLEIYTRLAELDPKNTTYKKEASRLDAVVKTERKKAEAERDLALRTSQAISRPSDFLTLLKFSWGTGGFGNVMIATFEIENSSPITIKDIEIACTHSGKSGTEIDSNTRVIYDVIRPHSKRTFRDVNMGFIHAQASSSRCRILSAVSR